MATPEELFDRPFSLEDDEEEYVGGGFEGDSALPEAADDKDAGDGDAETEEEKAAREAEEAKAKKAEEDAAAAKAPTDVAAVVASALGQVTQTFGAQLENMQAQFDDKLTKITDKLAEASEPKEEIPDVPTDEEWSKDANAASTKLQKRNEMLKEAENKARAKTDTSSQPNTDIATTGDLRADQEVSYGEAVRAVPGVGKKGTPEREIFERIYFHPRYKLNENPNGPALAAMATNFYIQQKGVKGGEAEPETTGGDVDINAITDPDQKIAAAQKIIEDTRSKKHGMTRSGKKQKASGPVALSAEHKKAARQMGVSDESYAEGMTSLGIGG